LLGLAQRLEDLAHEIPRFIAGVSQRRQIRYTQLLFDLLTLADAVIEPFDEDRGDEGCNRAQEEGDHELEPLARFARNGRNLRVTQDLDLVQRFIGILECRGLDHLLDHIHALDGSLLDVTVQLMPSRLP